jgi:hypothetical protein
LTIADTRCAESAADPCLVCVVSAQAKHAAFAAKRNQHYGNEAEAMKIAAALAAHDDDDDEDEDGVPPLPKAPNGTAARS